MNKKTDSKPKNTNTKQLKTNDSPPIKATGQKGLDQKKPPEKVEVKEQTVQKKPQTNLKSGFDSHTTRTTNVNRSWGGYSGMSPYNSNKASKLTNDSPPMKKPVQKGLDQKKPHGKVEVKEQTVPKEPLEKMTLDNKASKLANDIPPMKKTGQKGLDQKKPHGKVEVKEQTVPKEPLEELTLGNRARKLVLIDSEDMDEMNLFMGHQAVRPAHIERIE